MSNNGHLGAAVTMSPSPTSSPKILDRFSLSYPDSSQEFSRRLVTVEDSASKQGGSASPTGATNRAPTSHVSVTRLDTAAVAQHPDRPRPAKGVAAAPPALLWREQWATCRCGHLLRADAGEV